MACLFDSSEAYKPTGFSLTDTVIFLLKQQFEIFTSGLKFCDLTTVSVISHDEGIWSIKCHFVIRNVDIDFILGHFFFLSRSIL